MKKISMSARRFFPLVIAALVLAAAVRMLGVTPGAPDSDRPESFQRPLLRPIRAPADSVRSPTGPYRLRFVGETGPISDGWIVREGGAERVDVPLEGVPLATLPAHRIVCGAPRFVTRNVTIPEEPSGDVEVVLSSGRTLQVLVRDRGGVPIPGVEVAACSSTHPHRSLEGFHDRPVRFPSPADFMQRGRTREDGVCVLAGLHPRSDLFVDAVKFGWMRTGGPWIVRTAESAVELTMEPVRAALVDVVDGRLSRVRYPEGYLPAGIDDQPQLLRLAAAIRRRHPELDLVALALESDLEGRETLEIDGWSQTGGAVRRALPVRPLAEFVVTHVGVEGDTTDTGTLELVLRGPSGLARVPPSDLSIRRIGARSRRDTFSVDPRLPSVLPPGEYVIRPNSLLVEKLLGSAPRFTVRAGEVTRVECRLESDASRLTIVPVAECGTALSSFEIDLALDGRSVFSGSCFSLHEGYSFTAATGRSVEVTVSSWGHAPSKKTIVPRDERETHRCLLSRRR